MLFNKDLFMYNQVNDSRLDVYGLDMDIASLEADLERYVTCKHGKDG
jgi:hypothetical protein